MASDRDGRVIKTYVWHGDKCFFVSTIERDSSACVEPPAMRYNETMAWEYDWEKRERGTWIHQGDATKGVITEHQRVVEALFKTGKPPEDSNE